MNAGILHHAVESDGVGHAALGADLSANHPLLQELAAASMPGAAFPRMLGKVAPSGELPNWGHEPWHLAG